MQSAANSSALCIYEYYLFSHQHNVSVIPLTTIIGQISEIGLYSLTSDLTVMIDIIDSFSITSRRRVRWN